MKKLLKLTLLGLSLATAACAFAVTATSAPVTSKIGVVNYMAVFQQVPQGKGTLDKLKAQLAPQMQKLQQQQKTLATAIQTLERNAPTMTASDRQTQEAALTQQQQAFQQQVMTIKAAEMKKEESAANTFESDLNNAVAQVAKTGHYDLVLNDQAAPYYNSNYDVTSNVISVMQKMSS
ncbi:MAG: OmpH family outer membrane protein [Gammaproteobacteria bacterium]|nr:OmpH family outer membrane protein [Gammaproteobacteria bacterium]